MSETSNVDDKFERPISVVEVIKHPSIFISLVSVVIFWATIILKIIGIIKIGWWMLVLKFIVLFFGTAIIILIINEIKNQQDQQDQQDQQIKVD